MRFQEKVGEFLRLRDEGMLTQSEFDALVKMAHPPSLPVSHLSTDGFPVSWETAPPRH